MEDQNTVDHRDDPNTGHEMTCSVKYIFIDVVRFTHKRNVEAQSYIVRTLNYIVLYSIGNNKISESERIFIPTGDGICISLLNTEATYSFDIHMRVALDILKSLHEHNNNQNNEMRRFEVRIGINANEDNLVIDINGSDNLAGAGVSLAARIMDKADGNQILVGESVFDRLQQREKYMDKFRSFHATDKHGKEFRVYQYIDDSRVGLVTDTPNAFKETTPKPEAKLTLEIAYYLAHAIKNRPFISRAYKSHSPSGTVLQILLFLLSKDSAAMATESDSQLVNISTWKFNHATFEEQFEHYKSFDIHVISQLRTFISKSIRSKYTGVFEYNALEDLFVSEKGMMKLKVEFPSIWNEFDLEKYV